MFQKTSIGVEFNSENSTPEIFHNQRLFCAPMRVTKGGISRFVQKHNKGWVTSEARLKKYISLTCLFDGWEKLDKYYVHVLVSQITKECRIDVKSNIRL